MLTIGDLQSPSRKDFKKAAFTNAQTYNYYYTRMRNIAMSIYKWTGLPESCNARFLERQLYYRGFAGFVPDSVLGWLSLPLTPSGTINIYDESLYYDAFGNNYPTTRFPREEVVLVRNNLTCIPTDFAVRKFARQLYECECAIDTNISAQKTPVLIVCEDKQRYTMKNLYMQYDGNMPVIYGDKSLNPEALRVLKTDAPYIADKLTAHRAAIWSDFLTFLGVANIGLEKRERLTESESTANTAFYGISSELGLLTRREAAEELAAKTGLEISVTNRAEDAEMLHAFNLTLVENGVENAGEGGLAV